MNENTTKRREWVKNAAIIFLSVMLVLTFFSNTIMNYSLPEVAAQYIQSGSITAKIRGTGTVEASNPYVIEAKESRKVESVLVHAGDQVQKGEVLLVLADKESEELKAAETALEAAMAAYQKALLTAELTASDISAAGSNVSVQTYRNQITAAQNAVKAEEAKVKPLEEKVAALDVTIASYGEQLSYESSLDAAATERVTVTAAALKNAEDNLKYAETKLQEATSNYMDAKQKYDAEKALQQVSPGDAAYLKTLEDALKAEEEKLNAAKETYQNAVKAKEEAHNNYNNAVYTDKERQGSQTQVNLNEGKAALTVERKLVNDELEAAKKVLTQKQEELNKLVASISQIVGLEESLEAINKAQEVVDELRADTMASEIIAPISGTVTEITVLAGQSTQAGSTIVTMQPEGSGYQMNFSVTNDQAKRLSPGTEAELVNNWRYDDVVVTLKRIRPDATDPSQKKLLEFDITGSVVPGQSLSISVGDRSANYDMIVPNSAIREDNNGKFILIVETKSSPLGNRYQAARVDVEVVASDDTKSAITGALEGWEFVITTSNKPVEAGQLVRLPD